MNSSSQMRMGAALVGAPYANAHVVLALCATDVLFRDGFDGL